MIEPRIVINTVINLGIETQSDVKTVCSVEFWLVANAVQWRVVGFLESISQISAGDRQRQ